MRIRGSLQALGLLAFLFPSSVLGNDFNKFVPFKATDLSHYTGKQIFEAAYQAYLCSFLMHLADQKNKAKFLRWYSGKLMQEDSVKTHGKGWNDVNFPGASEATELSEEYSKRFNTPRSAAAATLLDKDPQCKTLNEFSAKALAARR